MKIKLAVFTLLGFAILVAGVLRVKSVSQEQQLLELQRAPDRGSIRWHALVAKAKGKRQVVLPSAPVEYSTAATSIDEVLPYFAAIVVEPISKKTLISSSNEVYRDNEIRTWYRCRILENLSRKPIPHCSTCATIAERIPQDLLPLNPDEVLIETNGGTVELEGVRVTVHDGEIPQFTISEQYLLFLSSDSSGQVGLIRMGPIGIYKVESSGVLTALSKEPHPVIQEIQTRYGGSLGLLREHIQKNAHVQ